MVEALRVHADRAPAALVPGSVYMLGANVEHDGRLSWVPPEEPGLVPVNAYVLVEDGRGLMIDTALPAVGDAVVEQLSSLGLDELQVLFTRPVEFDSMGNGERIFEHFDVTATYAEANFEPMDWTCFRADAPNPPAEFEDAIVEKDQELEFGSGRRLTLVNAKLKLLACMWVFDHATGTLFTSDSFLHTLAPDASTRIVTAANDTTTQVQVVDHLMAKFAWLQGANTAPLRDFVDEVFERFDVENVAPNFGCALSGRDVVRRHREMMDEGLRRLGAYVEEPV